jgi:hypothetical protein
MNLKDLLVSGGLLVVMILFSLKACYTIYKLNFFPIEFQGIGILLIFLLLIIFISIFVGRVIHFIFPMQTGMYDLNSSDMSIQVWKTLGFLNLFNLSVLIHTYLCPVNLRGLVYGLLGTHVGKFSMMGGKIIEPLMVSLGDEVILGEDSLVLGHLITKNKLFLGKVIIGNQVTIGVKSIIMPDVIIEDGAVVWAGSLVAKGTRIKKNEEWAGVPARKINQQPYSIWRDSKQPPRLNYNLFTKQFFSLMILITFILSGCTWNASIKNLDDDSVQTSDGQSVSIIPECEEDTPISKQCKVSSLGKIVTSIMGTNVISWSNPTLSNTIIANIPNGYYSNQMCYLQDTDLVPSNIKSGINIFGIEGNYIGTGSFQKIMASSALRDAGVQVISNLTDQVTSNQITLDNEQNTYAGADLPITGGYNYRDVPDVTKDDDGNEGITCKYAPRPANDCGATQNTIAGRIADCAIQNPLTATWNGATQCNRGQGDWKLVTRNGANKEVWQDQRTGQLWSSKVTSAMNWCQASGNTQLAPVTFSSSYNNTAGTPIIGNGSIGAISGGYSSVAETITITFTSATMFTVSGTYCSGGAITSGGLTITVGSTVTWSRANYCSFTLTQGSANFAVNDKFILKSVADINSCAPGSVLQLASPISYCAEVAGVNAPAGENWGSGVYMTAKGGMGKTPTVQSPSVRWRLPSIEDYMQASVNGIKFVMPDMGIAGVNRPSSDNSIGGHWEWSSSLVSSARSSAWYFSSSTGFISNDFRTSSGSVRCIGR